MTDDRRCLTRIVMRSGNGYMVFESFNDIADMLDSDDERIEVRSWAGSELMPPEQLLLAVSEISSVQEIALEDWIWSKQATELHYAARLRELEGTDQQNLLAVQQELVDAIRGKDSSD